MWYSTSQKAKGLEEKILEGNAEHSVRRQLFMTGDYNPDPERVAVLTKRVMKQLLDKYGNYNIVRHCMSGEQLMPAVNDIVDKVIKFGN